jgi:hypothetical protein
MNLPRQRDASDRTPLLARGWTATFATLACVGCVETADPVLGKVWDPQAGIALPVELTATGTGDLTTVTWTQTASIDQSPQRWRLLAGACGAAASIMTILSEGPWSATGSATDTNLPLGQCRGYRLLGVSGNYHTAPSAEAALTPSGCSSG